MHALSVSTRPLQTVQYLAVKSRNKVALHSAFHSFTGCTSIVRYLILSVVVKLCSRLYSILSLTIMDMDTPEQRNPAAVLQGPCDIKIVDWPVEDPGPNEVQVKVHSVGICGTDIHYWKSGELFGNPLPEPMVIGHETSGVVIKTGEKAGGQFQPGDRVHLDPAVSCHVCECCVAGNSHNCQFIKLGKMFHGSIRRVLNHPAEFTIKLPENLNMDEGAMIEPFAVGMYAVERGGLMPGQMCAVIGAGAIGAMIVLAAKASGASKICVVDISEPKLKLVREKLDSEVLTVLASKDPQETASEIEIKLGKKPDVVIDATCTQPGIVTAIYSAKPCGKVVLAGLAPNNCMLPMQHAAINEIDILPSLRMGHCYPRAVSLLREGKVNLKPIVAGRFPLRNTQEALEGTSKGLLDGFKNIIDCTQ